MNKYQLKINVLNRPYQNSYFLMKVTITLLTIDAIVIVIINKRNYL